MPYGAIFLGVASSGAGEIKRQRFCFRFDLNVRFCDGKGKTPAHRAGTDLKGKIAHGIHSHGKVLLAPADRLGGDNSAVPLDDSLRVHGGRIVHRETDMNRGVLLNAGFMERAGHDGILVHRIEADDLIIQII